jgi:hypothetical protein
LAAPLAAQDQKKEEAPKEPQVQKLFVLKYADPNQIANLIRVFTGNVTPNAEMHALAVSATKEAMTAIDDAIKRLDVPASSPQNVELTIWLLVGAGAEKPEEAMGSPAPKELDSVIAQLKNAFSYKEYRLLDLQTLRTRTGQEVSTTGMTGEVKIGSTSQGIITNLRVHSVTVKPDGSIRIDGLKQSDRVPYVTGSIPANGSLVNTQFNFMDLGINADLDVKEGQKVVVGKSGMNQGQAMFLVLSARVVQ